MFLRARILTYSICTEKPLRNKNVFKTFQNVSLSQSMFHARGTLETRPVRTYLLCEPLLRFGTLACISASECTRHCITHRKITIVLDQ